MWQVVMSTWVMYAVIWVIRSRERNHYKHALTIYLRQLDPEHVDVARCYVNLGNVCCDLGDPQRAKEYHKHALAIYLKHLDPEHVDVAGCYVNLGIVYRKLGDLQHAKEHYERALAIFLKRLGRNVLQ